jgi:hemolysin activation/secretion protein
VNAKPFLESVKRAERTALALLLFAAYAATAGAQTPPDPGALQRGQQQQRDFLVNPPQAPQAAPPAIRDEQAPAGEPGAASDARFVLRSLSFTPSHYLSDAQLQAVAASRIGQEVSYGELQKIIAEVNALYRERQILTARAILPPQRVVGGSVRIELVEGKLGQSSIEGNATTRATWIDGWLGARAGEPLDTAALERRIELFNHTNSTQLNARLRPGASFGATDLVVQAQEPPRHQLQLFADNMGAPSVGRNQIGASGTLNNPLGIGDQLGLYLVHSQGADSGALNYSVPVNQSGGRVSVSLSSLASHVVSGPYRDFDVNGRSSGARLQFSQPVARWGAWWLDGTLGGGVSRSSNRILGADLGDNSVRSLSLGLAATALYDARSFSLGLNYSANQMDAGGLEENRRANTWNLSGSWTEKTGEASYSVLRLGAQQTSAALLNASLAMQLGGPGTVRGYPLGAIAGDSGYYANLEWHRRLYDGVTGYVFADLGGVRTRDTPSQRISSVGLGVNVALPKGAQLSIAAAHALNVVTSDQSRWQVMARISWQVF